MRVADWLQKSSDRNNRRLSAKKFFDSLSDVATSKGTK
jgi:hypothetical protein